MSDENPVKEPKGVKETMEVLAALKVLGMAGKKIAANGIGSEDVAHVLEIFQNFQLMVDAIADVDEVIGELKDLDQAEILMLVTEVMSLVKAVKDA